MAQRRIGYGPPRADKTLGALPVIAEFCRRLDLAGLVDRRPALSATSPSCRTAR
ncbi:MAG: hypothetical protein ACRDYX_20985 [Egibacteraceae bacterium]